VDRRSFLSAATVTAAAPLAATWAIAQPATNAPARRPKLEPIAEAAIANRRTLNFDGRRFSGPAYDWLIERGSGAHAFLVGEEHGIAENPKLVAQLLTDLAPAGYRQLAIETSPPMAAALGQAVADGGVAGIRRLVTAPESRIAFFGLREEAEMLAAVHRVVGGRPNWLWGLDYEVGSDRFLIRRLKASAKPQRAADALARLEAASAASWARYDSSRNPQHIFSFAGDPALVAAVRRTWPGADADSRLILDTLQQTLSINQAWTRNQGYESNLQRSRFMRANLLRYWKLKQRQDRTGRLLMKMGASHMVRGLSMSDVFDLGTFVPELVAVEGGAAFHLLVLPGPGTRTANLDPTRFLYVPGTRDEYGAGMELFDQAVAPNGFTLFDTAPLRPLASSVSGDLPLPLWRIIHGFDAILILTGSTPSTNI
jgi:hypothetical protein